VQHYITDRVERELIILLGKLKPPATDGTAKLERHESFIVEVEFEEARVVLARTKSDRLCAYVLSAEACIILIVRGTGEPTRRAAATCVLLILTLASAARTLRSRKLGS
jgi:hypothetical protein